MTYFTTEQFDEKNYVIDTLNTTPYASTKTNKNKEEKTMKATTKNTKKVNANVKENKEEKKMTKAMNMAAAVAAQRAVMEAESGESYGIGEQTPDKYARLETVGMNTATLKSIDMVDVKYNAKEEGKLPKVMKAIKITLNDDEVVYINYNMFLYKEDEVQEVNIYDAIVTAKGDKGCYVTINEDALVNKKVEELTDKDIEFHTLKDNERIWIPAKKEFRALAKQLGYASIEFDDEGHADIPEQEVIVYVYEDAVDKKILKAKAKDTLAKYKVTDYFYNVSFIAPEDQPNMKYGRRFTTSTDANHRKELAELPGVVRYLENC